MKVRLLVEGFQHYRGISGISLKFSVQYSYASIIPDIPGGVTEVNQKAPHSSTVWYKCSTPAIPLTCERATECESCPQETAMAYRVDRGKSKKSNHQFRDDTEDSSC